ncbi:MAG: hypothetical protein HC815_30835 [Richelia sp. RM1_1_1]|nr:hypothetical protein [Richelia sp. RM1_1_1]
MTLFQPNAHDLDYYGVQSVGREPLRKYIDGFILIKEIADWAGDCAENWTLFDKHYVIFQLAQECFRKWEFQRETLDYRSQYFADQLIQQIPLNSLNALYAVLTDENCKPIKYYLDGWNVVDEMEENLGSHLQEIEDIDHWYFISNVANAACNQLSTSECCSVADEDLEELLQRLDEIGGFDGAVSLIQWLSANLQ